MMRVAALDCRDKRAISRGGPEHARDLRGSRGLDVTEDPDAVSRLETSARGRRIWVDTENLDPNQS